MKCVANEIHSYQITLAILASYEQYTGFKLATANTFFLKEKIKGWDDNI
jgi:hypothetical protein